LIELKKLEAAPVIEEDYSRSFAFRKPELLNKKPSNNTIKRKRLGNQKDQANDNDEGGGRDKSRE